MNMKLEASGVCNLVFNLTYKIHKKISADFFSLPFEISADSNGRLGSMIISARVSEQKILR